MKAEIICVGTELSLGEIVNTNSAWLALHMAEIGVETMRHTVVDDVQDSVEDAVQAASRRCELVIVTGGIGPTPDDLTRQAVAAVAGAPLVRDDSVYAHIAGMFQAWGRKMSLSNEIQADFPAGSVVIPNPRGTAAGFRISLNGAEIIVLPGVPSEMRAMWEASVRDYIVAKAAACGACGAVVTRTVNCFGRGESDITDAIKDLMAPGRNPSVGDTAEDAVIRIRIRAAGATLEEALALIEETRAEVRKRLGEAVFGDDDDTLQSVVVKALMARGETVAVAESCTGGLVSTRLTDIPGVSAAFLQGVVAYSNESKISMAGVPRSLIEDHGAVSEPVARALAEGIRTISGADYGLGVTGIAGPTGGTPAKPVGLVYIAVASAQGTTCRELRLRGTRDQIRDRATKGILNMLRLVLGGADLRS